MYEPSNDPPNPEDPMKNSVSGVWTILANTERWITRTLDKSTRAAAPGEPAGSNPYARKEVSYVCETATDPILCTANIFRRLRESRELGENHGWAQTDNSIDKGPDFEPPTLRQTLVVVIPWCADFESYHVYEALLKSINDARRNARDYITDVSLEKLKKKEKGIGEEMDWSVSVNAALLHPKYGDKTPEEIIKEMKKEDEEGEIDVNLKRYIEMRNASRKAPYPSVVIEVRATPPTAFSQENEQSQPNSSSMQDTQPEEKGNISIEQIEKLEALFGSSAISHPKEEEAGSDEDAFYDAIAKAVGKEIVEDPLVRAQNWISMNDPFFDEGTSTFTKSSATHVDAAYEYAFSSMAMHIASGSTQTWTSGSTEYQIGSRSYIVMPKLVSSSATSFEKFANEINKISRTIPGLGDLVSVTTMHPEQVQNDRRSPVPILVFQWYRRGAKA